eukprot:11694624-Alexandrium_andersonii.AAC.1
MPAGKTTKEPGEVLSKMPSDFKASSRNSEILVKLKKLALSFIVSPGIFSKEMPAKSSEPRIVRRASGKHAAAVWVAWKPSPWQKNCGWKISLKL